MQCFAPFRLRKVTSSTVRMVWGGDDGILGAWAIFASLHMWFRKPPAALTLHHQELSRALHISFPDDVSAISLPGNIIAYLDRLFQIIRRETRDSQRSLLSLCCVPTQSLVYIRINVSLSIGRLERVHPLKSLRAIHFPTTHFCLKF